MKMNSSNKCMNQVFTRKSLTCLTLIFKGKKYIKSQNSNTHLAKRLPFEIHMGGCLDN